ncbi:MAG: CehA/McbA family metallohydrolase [Pseudomonadales bacterium]|nr:CehA/McbA family metallohydrolase [Pseudomonadales bacterium]
MKQALCTCLLSTFLVALGGCGGSGSSSSDSSSASRESEQVAQSPAETAVTNANLLQDECVTGTQSKALQINDPNFGLEGPNALGSEGDFLIMNDRAAFVIAGLGEQKTYYHYPGILIDAVPLAECQQSADDNFYELALMMLRANIPNFTSSRMRAFRGESIEVINDGSDGEAAVVRVHGTDDRYWLVETVLMQEALKEGRPMDYSDPFNLSVAVDYILEPGASTLKVNYRLQNTLPGFNGITAAFALLNAGMGPELHSFSAFDVDVDRVVLEHQIPWITASDSESSYAYGEDTKFLTTVDVIGVFGTADLGQVANTYFGNFLNANGQEGDTVTREFYVSVADGDELVAVKNYIDDIDPKIERHTANLKVQAIDKESGEPLTGVKIEVQTKKQVFLQYWPYESFLTTYTDEQGQIETDIPLVSYLSAQHYRVLATLPGRANPAAITIFPGETNELVFEFDKPGRVAYDFKDDAGNALPTQITFWQGDQRIERLYLNKGQGVIDIQPGDYDVGISHGWEYEVVEKSITVVPGEVTPLAATLKHWVDTTGYMTFDAHVHSSPSPDSTVSPVDRITTAAAAGLEVVVSTDHEIVTDLSPAVIGAGLQDWVATVIGQEVTAGMPNHTIAYPLPKQEDQPRGNPIEWYGMSIGDIYAAERARGAQVRTLAHPRLDLLNVIEWDRIEGAPTKANNDGLGIPEGADMWSWDFEAMEYMNGVEKIFSTGLYEDWMSFINHGYRITATGSSDMHYHQTPGMPRNYYKSSTDNPAEFVEQELVDSVLNNHIVVSTGAFARVAINDSAEMGDTITDTDGSVDLYLHVEALPQTDMSHMVAYVNCDETLILPAENPSDSAIKFSDTVALTLPEGKDAHVVVLGFGAERMNRELPQYDPVEIPRFTTNPIYVDGDGNGIFDAPGGKTCQYTY